MPRQDVPYGGAICRLKEKIAEIWDKLGEKLHSINGVEGDAAGDVKIISSDPAVVITNNAASHEIEIGLDSLELPSAAVTSVNGETGAVVLTAEEIGSNGNSDVQTDINGFRSDINGINIGMAAETNARLQAEAALQNNINAVSASIPEMSTTPDPYKGVERDAQGRAFAADPASGATDRSLTTANWVSQTSQGVNNLMHKNARETVDGRKDFISYIGPVIMANNINVNTAPADNQFKPFVILRDINDREMVTMYAYQSTTNAQGYDMDFLREGTIRCRLHLDINADGGALLEFQTPKGSVTLVDTR